MSKTLGRRLLLVLLAFILIIPNVILAKGGDKQPRQNNENSNKPYQDHQEAPPATPQHVSVHDPSIIKVKDKYYVFGSHIEAAWSTDLQSWTRFTNGYTTPRNVLYDHLSENLAESFQWAGENDSDSKGGFSVWAPEIIWNEHYVNDDGSTGAFMMYYSASSTYIRSAIGYAVSKTIEGPYKYVDTIVYSGFTNNDAYDADSVINKNWRKNTHLQQLVNDEIIQGARPGWFNNNGSYNNGNFPNAIDANLFFDEEGKLWMTYGSWSGGIFTLEIDKVTGKAIYPGRDGTTADGRLIDRYFGTKISGGHLKSGEGPYVVYDKETGYYYLYVTYGWLASDGGYHMRLFRSTSPEGPYLDALGQNAVLPGNVDHAPYGIKLMSNFLFERNIGDPGTGIGFGYVSPGHNSFYTDPETGKRFLVFHTRFPQRGEAHEVRVHQMFMNSDGWPVVSPYPYTGETLKKMNRLDAVGEYKFINHGKDNSITLKKSVFISLNQDGTISGGVSGTWEKTGHNRAEIIINDIPYDGVFVRQWDPESQLYVMTFTAMSHQGVTIWGSKQQERTDRQVVEDVKADLNLGDLSNVVSSITLPTEGTRNSIISWATSNPTVITNTGVVKRPGIGEENAAVTVTATITKGDVVDTKTFQLTVLAIQKADLTAHFSFDGDLTDHTGNFDPATITGNRINNTGGTITYADGQFGNAAVFNGSSGVRLPNGLITSNAYSVSLWLKPEEITPFTTTFFGARNDVNWLSLVPQGPAANNTMVWSGSERWYDAPTGTTIPANHWTHVAFTVDNGAVVVYINGVARFTGSNFPNIFTDQNGSFSLGVNYWDIPYKGLIDDLRIYEGALNADEVAEIAKQEARLVAHYAFEETLIDSTTNFAPGTVTGNRIDNTNGTITYADGQFGKAAVFKGSSGVRLPNGLISSNLYSVSFWLKPEVFTQFSTTFFGARDNNSWISLVPAGPGAEQHTMLWSGTQWYDATTGMRIPPNEWTHLAFTVDNGNVVVYVNGEAKFTGGNFPNVFTTNSGTFGLGVNWWDTPFKGMMDDLRIYEGVLTPNQISSLNAK
jgi:arabinan endo-1,5-alpha-L-arabinosidase